MIKVLSYLAAITLLSPSLAACGGTASRSSSTTRISANVASGGHGTRTLSEKDANDYDNDATTYDDGLVMDYGAPADPADRRAIASLVQRYYAAAAAGDGREGCSLLESAVAETVPEEYGHTPGHLIRGKTCAAVLTKLFEQFHGRLAANRGKMGLIRVRVEADKGLAVLHLATTAEPRKITLRRERGKWRLVDLFDSGMP
jgi:hypothetical protein